MTSKTIRIIPFLLSVFALVLEILPFGAVLNFAEQNNDGTIETVRKVFSYFDLTPYGYANFGPFLTAMLTCVLLIVSLIYFFRSAKGVATALKVVSFLAVITSLLPLIMFGFSYFSALGILISVVLVIELIYVLVFERAKLHGR